MVNVVLMLHKNKEVKNGNIGQNWVKIQLIDSHAILLWPQILLKACFLHHTTTALLGEMQYRFTKSLLLKNLAGIYLFKMNNKIPEQCVKPVQS